MTLIFKPDWLFGKREKSHSLKMADMLSCVNWGHNPFFEEGEECHYDKCAGNH